MKNLFAPLAITVLMLASSSCDEDLEQLHNRKAGEQLNSETTTSSFNSSTIAGGGFHLAMNDKVSFGNLNIFPVYAASGFVSAHQGMGKYTTLKEGVAAGSVIVTEHEGDPALMEHRSRRDRQRNSNRGSNSVFSNGTILSNPFDGFAAASANNNSEAGPSVGSLAIENKGDDTVIVLAGELVQGGDQDRIVAADMLLKPHSGKVELPVFCVESNRWSHEGFYDNSTRFGFTNNFASSSIRRIVTQKKDQNAVWSRVKEVTDANSAQSETNSYNALEKSVKFTGKRKNYLDVFEKAFENKNNIIGVIVADKNNNVIACDLFCSEDLFRKEYKSLIHSYITEAISAENGVSASENQVSPERYFRNITSDYEDTEEKAGVYKLFNKGRVIHYARF